MARRPKIEYFMVVSVGVVDNATVYKDESGVLEDAPFVVEEVVMQIMTAGREAALEAHQWGPGGAGDFGSLDGKWRTDQWRTAQVTFFGDAEGAVAAFDHWRAEVAEFMEVTGIRMAGLYGTDGTNVQYVDEELLDDPDDPTASLSEDLRSRRAIARITKAAAMARDVPDPRRRPVYQEMFGFLYVVMARVEASEPVIRFAEDRRPPDPPEDEEFRKVQVLLRSHGSEAVGDAFDEFSKKSNAFWGHVVPVRAPREQGGRAQAREAHQAVLGARDEVRESLRKLERLVSEELATL